MALVSDWVDVAEVTRPDWRRRIERPVDVLAYVLAGNATFTLEFSTRAGKETRFTYRVALNDAGTMYFVALLVGPNNEADYQYIGMLSATQGANLRLTAKSKAGDDAMSVRAFRRWWRALTEKNEAALDLVEFWHEGRCGRCGRLLTVPSSVARGIGPECYAKMGM